MSIIFCICVNNYRYFRESINPHLQTLLVLMNWPFNEDNTDGLNSRFYEEKNKNYWKILFKKRENYFLEIKAKIYNLGAYIHVRTQCRPWATTTTPPPPIAYFKLSGFKYFYFFEILGKNNYMYLVSRIFQFKF